MLIWFLLRPSGSTKTQTNEETEDPTDGFYQQALAGFILVLTEEGDMVFLSDSASKYIGIAQVSAVPTCSIYKHDILEICDIYL